MPTRLLRLTLIELMIVAVITGILAAIALLVYQQHILRAQVSEGLNLKAPVNMVVALGWAEKKDLFSAWQYR
ncbi:MAG: hypothetical protein QF841_00030 [Arenicellales bacterium]|nr:hypothetical protein [Arenicellales bacterium]